MENKNNNLSEENKNESGEITHKINFSFFKGLINFLKEYSVIGLAIGVIVGQASKDLVDSMVKGVFMPFIELLISRDKFNNLVFVVYDVKFDVGSILSSFLTFLVIMTLLYFIVKKIIKDDKFLPKK